MKDWYLERADVVLVSDLYSVTHRYAKEHAQQLMR
jgi:hypothetical protein